ncbi:MAG: 3-(3-hydroxy-phenyl)propionate hydroxylase [Solirubrobacteraceae bacterium]
MTSPDFDVAIIGAGPVGSTGARLAARHGLRCLVVDETTSVFPQPRAIHFDADAMRIFQFAGLSKQAEAISRATTGGVHLGADGEPIRVFRVPDRPGDLGWRPHYMFSQPELDAMLRAEAEAASGVDARFGWRCEGVEDDGTSVRVSLKAPDGELHTTTTAFAIAADGAASATRKAIGLRLDDYGFDEPWVVVDIDVGEPELGPDHTIMYCDPGRPSTYIPGPAGHRRWEFLLKPGETGDEQTTPDGVRSLIAAVTPWLDGREYEIVRVAVYRFHGLVAEGWRAGRVFLAGDAAHQTPPFYGQGMCHGLRDMRNLMWKLAGVLDGRYAEEVLDTYQAEREPHVRAVIEAAIANGRYISTLDPGEAAERDRGLRARMSEGRDVRSFREVIPGLQAGLLDSDPRSDARGLLFVQPSVMADGSTVMLDEVLGAGWALVTSADAAPDGDLASLLDSVGVRAVVEGSTVQDPSGLLDEWFAAFGCAAALIRPDRYVFGTAASGVDTSALIARLIDALPATRTILT